MNNVGGAALHCHVAVGAAVSKGAPLFLEGDEVPHGHHGVVRHVEVEQLHAGEGFESAQLARRAGEVLGHEKAICGEQRRKGEEKQILQKLRGSTDRATGATAGRVWFLERQRVSFVR